MKLLFMHIPKTAGSSFRRVLQHAEIALGREPCPTPDDRYLDYDTFVAQRASLARRYQFIPGHYPFHAWEEILDGAQLITVFREPLSRCLSHIKHQIRQESEAAGSSSDRIDVNAFLQMPRNELFLTSLANLTVKYLSYGGHPDDFHKEGDLSLDLALAHCQQIRFGFADQLDAFLEGILFDGFDAPRERMEEIFATRPQQRLVASTDRFSVTDLSAENLDRVRALNRLDIELYDSLRARRRR